MPRGVYERSGTRALRVIDHRPAPPDPFEGLTKEELKDRIADLDRRLGEAISAKDMKDTEINILTSDVALLENRCDLYERLLSRLERQLD